MPYVGVVPWLVVASGEETADVWATEAACDESDDQQQGESPGAGSDEAFRAEGMKFVVSTDPMGDWCAREHPNDARENRDRTRWLRFGDECSGDEPGKGRYEDPSDHNTRMPEGDGARYSYDY